MSCRKCPTLLHMLRDTLHDTWRRLVIGLIQVVSCPLDAIFGGLVVTLCGCWKVFEDGFHHEICLIILNAVVTVELCQGSFLNGSLQV